MLPSDATEKHSSLSDNKLKSWQCHSHLFERVQETNTGSGPWVEESFTLSYHSIVFIWELTYVEKGRCHWLGINQMMNWKFIFSLDLIYRIVFPQLNAVIIYYWVEAVVLLLSTGQLHAVFNTTVYINNTEGQHVS